jgi:hypothetical protein
MDEGALIAPTFEKASAPEAPPTAGPEAGAAEAGGRATGPDSPAVSAPESATASERAAPLLQQVDELAALEAATALAAEARPRFSMTVAVGFSLDNVGIADHRNVMVPSLAVTGGVGQDLLGFEARLFASEAAGRYSTPNLEGKPIADVGADRQAVDLLLAVRPFAGVRTEDVRWWARFMRAFTLNAGGSGERVSVGPQTVFRLGAVVGAHADFPITPARERSQLLASLSVRRMFGSGGQVDSGGKAEPVGDTKVEALAGLAFVF